jgi:urease accessory protein
MQRDKCRLLMSDWLIWQLADSAFPTGGFAHSNGLEAAWQNGEVADEPALRQFVGDVVLQAGHAAMPLVTAAWRDPERLEELDELCDAFLTNTVANRASRAQGRAWLATWVRVYPGKALAELDRRARSLRIHYAPAVGVTCRALDVPLSTTQRLLLHFTIRGVLAAAVRLGLVGAYRAQRLQLAAAAGMDRVLERCGDLDDRDVAHTAPILDLLQASHDRLYSRLFQS